ncbi:hypothetical protein V492_06322 [Pseudogymnoascus sp. VKM F-4246]|nr:hypothetical protein V492_06322 [Pseudogymnoascus sp. VKM F-4246]
MKENLVFFVSYLSPLPSLLSLKTTQQQKFVAVRRNVEKRMAAGGEDPLVLRGGRGIYARLLLEEAVLVKSHITTEVFAGSAVDVESEVDFIVEDLGVDAFAVVVVGFFGVVFYIEGDLDEADLAIEDDLGGAVFEVQGDLDDVDLEIEDDLGGVVSEVQGDLEGLTFERLRRGHTALPNITMGGCGLGFGGAMGMGDQLWDIQRMVDVGGGGGQGDTVICIDLQPTTGIWLAHSADDEKAGARGGEQEYARAQGIAISLWKA